jgi:hypothetical protein
MKKLLITLLTIATVPLAFAQGTFNAYNIFGEGLVYAEGRGLAGSDYNVQVYWGVIGTSESSLIPAGPVTALFGTTGSDGSDMAGQFYIGGVDLYPGSSSGPASVLIQIRGFERAFPGNSGSSQIVTQPLAFGTALPADLVPMSDWVIGPEPSTLALASLGAAVMFFFRRRKQQ